MSLMLNPSDRIHVKIAVPCPTCRFHGLCLIESQIEQDLVLTVVGVGLPVALSLSCSVYVELPEGERPAPLPRRAGPR